MELNKIYQGDSLEVLKTLDSESIDCCITSPPYWGLRDYGTATWEDGDVVCDHKGKIMATHNKLHEGQPKNELNREFFKEVCGKCGAKRIDQQLSLEKTPEEYVAKLVGIFREVKRVLKKEGTCWLNLGDSYASNGKSGGDIDLDIGMDIQRGRGRLNEHSVIKQKDLVGTPWRVAFALQADGWYLRQDIIWHKPNPMPESVTDRCTKSHEYVFLLSKNSKYYFDNEAIKEKSVGTDPRMVDGFVPKLVNGKHKNDPQNTTNRKKYESSMAGGGASMTNHNGYFKVNGDPIGEPGMRNKRDVWTVTVSPFAEAHFATFPKNLIEPMVKAGCPINGVVLDPFMGSGTTALVAKNLGRQYIGIELNPEYIKIAENRLKQDLLL